MALRVYRVCRAIHAELDGQGARIAGGRWNSPGRAMVYMAESVSLAVLENLVHMSKEDFPTGYVTVEAVIPDSVAILQEEERRRASKVTPAMLGDRWLASMTSAVLRVPSAVVPSEHNFLLNPLHPQFSEIVVEPAKKFRFDPRMFA